MVMVIICLMIVNNYLVGGWPTPLKNDGVRQLGWWNSQKKEKQKMFQTTEQIVIEVIGIINHELYSYIRNYHKPWLLEICSPT